ncbi:chemotaxis protein [Pseudomonas sp. Lz4W]|uniref:methyl-accepting chemotaxis protein n=1 Tax=Pseudomonas sp. Lz4W TaxID=1206777 RepID=UPI0002BF97BD|nr:methyl-accepting chemotaxis protein [Pseudomonas sp. Lz4W]AUB77216.1 chemotaxis protein [Pseudomonas sp. Lz4W]
MYRQLARLLGNIGVNRKLGLGFGLVLVLTVLISAIGWKGLVSVIDRGDKLANISKTIELTKDLRIARLDYERDKGEKGNAEVNGQLTALDQTLDLSRRQLTDPAELALVEQQLAAVAEYKSAFADSGLATQAREANRVLLGSTADSAVASVADIEQTLLQSDSLAQYKSVIELQKLLQQARFQVRGYTYSASPEAEQPALDAIDHALKELDSLPARLPDEHLSHLQQATLAMQNYRAAVTGFRDAQVASARALTRMQQQGSTLIDLSQKLSTLQTEKRDQDSQQAENLLIGCTLLALVLGIIAAWVITRQIVIPLQRTLKTVEWIAAGDLSHDNPTARRDELGQLQHAVQRMTEGLRELIGGISDGVTQIASAAEELSAVTEQTSAGVNSQKVETDQVATAMHEMAATVQEVARNAEEASEAAVVADQQSREGDKVVGEAIAQIEKLAIEVGHSTEAMDHLKRESDKIGSVLDVIKSVAQQTNLLALNAAIEAARAGEAGRGFAVVADEVRSLAQRTQKSTEEIEELIEGLQSGTRQASSSMDSSRILTDSSVELTRRAGEALGSITRTVSTIQGMNQQIAAAAEQQSAVAEEINRSVLNVRDVSEQTAAASEETAASSVELARLGAHLQALVARFKV